MNVPTGLQDIHVKGDLAFGDKTFQEMPRIIQVIRNSGRSAKQFGILIRRPVPSQMRPAADIGHRPNPGQRFIHRHIGGFLGVVIRAKSPNPLLLTQRRAKRLPQRQSQILVGVVKIHVEIPFGLEANIEKTVLGKELQHVIQEPDSRRNRGSARPVEIQSPADGDFLRLPFE